MYIETEDQIHYFKHQLSTRNSHLQLKKIDKLKKLPPQEKEYQHNTIVSPYLTEIQRNKKIRSVIREKLKRESSNKRQSSLKKFRIQQISYVSKPRNNSTSTHKKIVEQKSMKTTLHTIKNNNANQSKSRKLRLYKKNLINYYDSSLAQQQNHQEVREVPAFNQLYNKLSSKISEVTKQQKKFRRNKYIDLSYEQKQQGQQLINPNLRKIAYTVNNIEKNNETIINHELDELKHNKKTVGAQRKNFRKGKYEVTHSQFVVQKHLSNQEIKERPDYSSVDIHKKESNSSLIRQMDLQTQKEIELQQRAIKFKMTKLMEKSLEKSIEEYFKEQHNHKRIKSKNQIQIFISTVKNPSINKCSQASTMNISDKKQKNHENYLSIMNENIKNQQQLMHYDFSLENDLSPRFAQNHSVQQEQEQQPQILQQSSHKSYEITTFDKQRKEAQKNFINNGDLVKISWSEDQLESKLKKEQLQDEQGDYVNEQSKEQF